MSDEPHNLRELKLFYRGVFAPLYDYLVSHLGRVPEELHFEESAALDHIMRVDDNDDEVAITKAAGHLKRATFDAFKLLYLNVIRAKWVKLTSSRYANVDNGAFIPRIDGLWIKASDISRNARALERIGDADDSAQWTAAFNEWNKLIPVLDALEREERSDGARRARLNYRRYWLLQILIWVAMTALSYLAWKGLDALWQRFFA